jgi:hypothetical protein
MSDSPAPLFCANHPGVETYLRCKRCNKPICSKCAILTPTGYICPECESLQQKSFDTALPVDYILAILITLVLSGIGSLIAQSLGFFTILLAPAAGVIIAEIVRAVIRRRRARLLFQTVAASAVLGSLPMLLIAMLRQGLWGIAIAIFYTITITTTVYQRLKGISLR